MAGSDADREQAGVAAPHGSLRSHLPDVAAVAGLGLLSLVLVALLVRADPVLSLHDEIQHVDYLAAVLDGDLIVRGDVLGDVAVQADVCRGNPLGVPLPALCGADVTAEEHGAARGVTPLQYAFVHPPAYYAITGVGARAVQAVSGADDLVTAGRLVSGLWLVAGLAATWIVGRQLAVPRAALAGAWLLVAATPTVLHTAAIVNPDATALLLGSLVFAAALRWQRTGRGLVWLALAGFAAGAFKSTHAFAAMAAGVFLLWSGHDPDRAGEHWWQRYDGRAVVAAGVVVGAAVAAVVLWVGVVELTATIPSDELPPQASDIPDPGGDEHLANVATFVSPVRAPYLPAPLDVLPTFALLRFTDVALAGGVLAAAMTAAGRRQRSFAVGLLVTMLFGGLLLGIAQLVALDKFFLVPPRYGIALAGGMAAAVGLAWFRPVWRWLLLAAGALAVAYDLWRLWP